MAHQLTSYPKPTSIQSALLKKIPEAIPATSDLRALQEELIELKKATLARSKKAGEDMKAIEESMRRMKEREKGKAKASLDKIRRERDFPNESRLPSHSSLANSNRGSIDRRLPVDDTRKKKKRKLSVVDSDAERGSDQRPRKSPPIAHVTLHHPVKAQKSVIPASHPHLKPAPGPDFTLPPTNPLLPPRPPIPPAPIPGPSKPTDVMDDFSKLRPPATVAVSTFYSSIEPWIRNIREEDVGFLEHTGDEIEPYIMPKLGRHYLEVWEDQDAATLAVNGVDPHSSDTCGPVFDAPVPKWDPSTLTETDLVTEERGHGPLTERVISALMPLPDEHVSWKGVKAAEDQMEGRPGGSGAAAARKERLNVTELEARIRDTMRFHGLLDAVPNFSEKVDDPIATALRHAQRELRKVVTVNKARKQRLISIALDRLAYQEYLEARETIDRNITALYAKLQKKDNPKCAKKKLKQKASDLSGTSENSGNGQGGNGPPSSSGGGVGGAGGGGTTMLAPCPASLGLSPDDELRLHVNEQLKQLVKTRRQWVDTIGAVFEEKQRLQPGRIWGVPTESIYSGIEEEVAETLVALEGSSVSPVVEQQSLQQQPKVVEETMHGGIPPLHEKGKTKVEPREDVWTSG